jgi:phosphatidylserine decarboxylase
VKSGIVSGLLRTILGLRIAPGGWSYVLVFCLWGFLFIFLGRWFSVMVGALFMVFGSFCLYFFRDPEPDLELLKRDNVILSPAQGKVMEIARVDGEGYGPGQVIRIFLSVFDVHTQRAPVGGTIKSVEYQAGLFLDARDQRAHVLNEQNSILMESPLGPIMVKQIAGLIARRIVCWVRVGDEARAGELIGLIRFGSQVDLYIPLGAAVQVKEGDRVWCGKTILAEMGWAGAKEAAAPR